MIPISAILFPEGGPSRGSICGVELKKQKREWGRGKRE
jgi:hypothetical protein